MKLFALVFLLVAPVAADVRGEKAGRVLMPHPEQTLRAAKPHSSDGDVLVGSGPRGRGTRPNTRAGIKTKPIQGRMGRTSTA